MTFLLIIAVILAALKLTGKINISWIVVGIVAAVAVIPAFLENGLSSLFSSSGSGSNSGVVKDACGCAPGQNVSVAKKGLFGYKNKAVLPCSQALVQLTKKKYYNLGCVNT